MIAHAWPGRPVDADALEPVAFLAALSADNPLDLFLAYQDAPSAALVISSYGVGTKSKDLFPPSLAQAFVWFDNVAP